MCYCSLTAGGVLCRPNIAHHCSFIARTRGGRQTNIGWGGEGGVAGIGVISGALVSASSRGTVISDSMALHPKHSTGTKTYFLSLNNRDCHCLNQSFLIYSPPLRAFLRSRLAPNSPQLHNHLTRTRAQVFSQIYHTCLPTHNYTCCSILTQRQNKPSYYAETIATIKGIKKHTLTCPLHGKRQSVRMRLPSTSET